MKISTIVLVLLFLCACGQGGDGSSEESSASGMESLDVSRDFAFIGGESLTITIIDEGTTNERRYLNICSDFTDDNGEYNVSYDSCLLRTSLQSKHNDFEITISSNQQELVAQIWPLRDGALPVNHSWSRSEDGNDWLITLY